MLFAHNHDDCCIHSCTREVNDDLDRLAFVVPAGNNHGLHSGMNCSPCELVVEVAGRLD